MTKRTYDVRAVALAVDSPPKWVDNLLSHFEIPGCSSERRGVGRRISDTGARAIALVRILNADLSIPLARCAAIVTAALASGTPNVVVTESGVRLELPIAEIERSLQPRLADALEAAPRVARGRPPQRLN